MFEIERYIWHSLSAPLYQTIQAKEDYFNLDKVQRPNDQHTAKAEGIIPTSFISKDSNNVMLRKENGLCNVMWFYSVVYERIFMYLLKSSQVQVLDIIMNQVLKKSKMKIFFSQPLPINRKYLKFSDIYLTNDSNVKMYEKMQERLLPSVALQLQQTVYQLAEWLDSMI